MITQIITYATLTIALFISRLNAQISHIRNEIEKTTLLLTTLRKNLLAIPEVFRKNNEPQIQDVRAVSIIYSKKFCSQQQKHFYRQYIIDPQKIKNFGSFSFAEFVDVLSKSYSWKTQEALCPTAMMLFHLPWHIHNFFEKLNNFSSTYGNCLTHSMINEKKIFNLYKKSVKRARLVQKNLVSATVKQHEKNFISRLSSLIKKINLIDQKITQLPSV